MKTTPQGCFNKVAVLFHVGLDFNSQHLPRGGQPWLREKMASCVSGTFVYKGGLICCGGSCCADEGLLSAGNLLVWASNLREAILATLPVNYREKLCAMCNHQHIRLVTESARDYLRFNLNSFWCCCLRSPTRRKREVMVIVGWKTLSAQLRLRCCCVQASAVVLVTAEPGSAQQ